MRPVASSTWQAGASLESAAQDPDIPGVELAVTPCADLAARDRQHVHDLFARSYADANHAYLDHSMERLRFVGLAWRGEQLVGFALADTRFSEVPRIPEPQLVTLGGIGCIEPTERRTGIFSRVSNLAAAASGLLERPHGRVLAGGRMAHPAGFRAMTRIPTVLPREGAVLSSWHLEVAEAVARLYGVSLKPGSLVVQGTGRPIGWPNIQIDVSEAEWRPFAAVDRSRGDSLLGLAWAPDAPEGW